MSALQKGLIWLVIAGPVFPLLWNNQHPPSFSASSSSTAPLSASEMDKKKISLQIDSGMEISGFFLWYIKQPPPPQLNQRRRAARPHQTKKHYQ